jgi:hypothetical protein
MTGSVPNVPRTGRQADVDHEFPALPAQAKGWRVQPDHRPVGLSPLASEAQQPTPQQQSAIRQSCRSDFQATVPAFPRRLGSVAVPEAELRQELARVSAGARAGDGRCRCAREWRRTATGPALRTAERGAAPRCQSGRAGEDACDERAAGRNGGGGQPPTMREELMLTREMCGPNSASTARMCRSAADAGSNASKRMPRTCPAVQRRAGGDPRAR